MGLGLFLIVIFVCSVHSKSIQRRKAGRLKESAHGQNSGLYIAQRISFAIQRGSAASILETLLDIKMGCEKNYLMRETRNIGIYKHSGLYELSPAQNRKLCSLANFMKILSAVTELSDNKYNILAAPRDFTRMVDTPLNKNEAKNVILFLGDGMSITTLAATRAYLGQKHGYKGEELKLSFEGFPYTGLAKTYCVDNNVADSACSGTAYLTGVKANSGTVGLSAAVKRGDCEGQRSGRYSVTGLMDWAQRAQKRTGIVTTTRVTHATPAASYAHSADRWWEADTDLPSHSRQCEDIASQLVRGHVGSNIDVVLGGGRNMFFSKGTQDVEGNFGYRSDGADLISEWLLKKESQGLLPKFVYNRTELLSVNANKHASLLGLFSADHMPYHLEAPDDDPTLSEMTLKAIEMLAAKKKGFFLFVEGGRIDTAHHETKARKALDETAELAKAVEAALGVVDLRDTLVVVTSDHSHTMTYSGYSKRGTDILGFTNKKNASDSLPYTTLSYANGPGYKPHTQYKRHNLLLDDINHLNFTYPSLVPLSRETHGGEDVAVFATGPFAHLFTGHYEQNYIPHAIAYAACMGPQLTSCK